MLQKEYKKIKTVTDYMSIILVGVMFTFIYFKYYGWAISMSIIFTSLSQLSLIMGIKAES